MIAIPEPAAPRAVVYPAAVHAKLSTGLEIAVVAQHHVPLVAAQLVVRKGGADAPPGVAALTAALLPYGTRNRSALDIALTCDGLGLSLSASASYDGTNVVVSSLSANFPQALGLLAEIVREPAFDDAEIDRARSKAHNDLQVALRSPGSLARLAAARAVFGNDPYGLPLFGSGATLDALHRGQIVEFHKRAYRPEDAMLVIVGDVSVDEAMRVAEDSFGDWRSTAIEPPVRAPATFRHVPLALAIDLPGAGRTAIALATIGIARSSPAYYAGVVATAVLSGYSGRLNQEVRVKRGLSYGAGAAFQPRRTPGPFYATTLVDNAKALEGTQVMLDTLKGFAGAPVTEEELTPRRAVVRGNFDRSIESATGLVSTLGDFALSGVPLDELGRFTSSVDTIDSAAVEGFAAGIIGAGLSIVLAGDASIFYDEFVARFPHAQRIPAASLALTGPELQAPI